MASASRAWDDVPEEDTGWREWSVLLDTDSYAGNFERAMVAAVTGSVDDTGHDAQESAEKFYDGAESLTDAVVWFDGEHCARNAEIECAPGSKECGTVRIRFDRELTTKELAGIVRRAEAFGATESGYPKGRRYRLIAVRLERERKVTQARAVWP